MTEATSVNPAAAKRRQYLLLGGIACAIIAAALLSVALTGSRNSGEHAPKPKSTNILAPGSQVDPRDAWRGQADAQLKAIEQKSREISQRNSEMEGQNKTMLERLQKLEQPKLTPLPPPPVAVPAARPDLARNRLAEEQGATSNLQRLPPPPPARPASMTGISAPGAVPGGSPSPASSGIVRAVTSRAAPSPARSCSAASMPRRAARRSAIRSPSFFV